MWFTKVGVLNWYSSMKKKFRKIWTNFDIEKLYWNWNFCNFVSLSTLSEKVQKKFQWIFCDSADISIILISFHQILLTWWNAYNRSTKSHLSQNSNGPLNPSQETLKPQGSLKPCESLKPLIPWILLDPWILPKIPWIPMGIW